MRRILVVDDDPDVDLLLRTRLAARGYEVSGAMDGREALECIESAAPDLNFLDVSMPGIGGLVEQWLWSAQCFQAKNSRNQ